jgi:hypothetical protein
VAARCPALQDDTESVTVTIGPGPGGGDDSVRLGVASRLSDPALSGVTLLRNGIFIRHGDVLVVATQQTGTDAPSSQGLLDALVAAADARFLKG